METSEVMRKVAAEKRAPAKLRGHVVLDEKDPEGHFRLYPQVDPSAYYLIAESCVLGMRDLEAERVEVLVSGDCEVEQVSRNFVAAANLRYDAPCPRDGCDCGCGGKGKCGQGKCGKGGGPPWGTVVYQYYDRNDRIRFVIAWARWLNEYLDGEEPECASIISYGAACCDALKDVVKNPNPQTADTALCICGLDC
jgi:hypothetical protein